MRRIIVEPHPDDAFLSLGWHLEEVWKDDDKTIITVFHDEKRGREAEEYAGAVGAKWIGLGLAESQMLSRVESVRPVPELREVLAGLADESGDTVFIFPLGLQHPDHLRVSVSRPPGASRYVDTPYQTKQKLAEEVAKKVSGMVIESMVYPGARKWRHEKVFKSQSRFFYYNGKLKDSMLPEMVIRDQN